jgi:hypothetical protein
MRIGLKREGKFTLDNGCGGGNGVYGFVTRTLWGL